MAHLEHVNVTVADPKGFAALLIDLFGWKTRWEGASLDGAGYTVHVGTDDSYIALYSGSKGAPTKMNKSGYNLISACNHIGIIVDDLAAMEAKVKAKGFQTHSHADYEPGRRFYFDTPHDVEIELICYD